MNTEFKLEYSKYRVLYNTKKPWEYKIFSGDTDVTDTITRLNNNFATDLILALTSLFKKRTDEIHVSDNENDVNFVKYVVTPKATYQLMDGELIKIPTPSNNGNP